MARRMNFGKRFNAPIAGNFRPNPNGIHSRLDLPKNLPVLTNPQRDMTAFLYHVKGWTTGQVANQLGLSNNQILCALEGRGFVLWVDSIASGTAVSGA